MEKYDIHYNLILCIYFISLNIQSQVEVFQTPSVTRINTKLFKCSSLFFLHLNSNIKMHIRGVIFYHLIQR